MAHLLLRGARAGAATSLRLAAVSNAQTGATAAARCFATDATAAKVWSLITEQIFLSGMDCSSGSLLTKHPDDAGTAECRLRLRPTPPRHMQHRIFGTQTKARLGSTEPHSCLTSPHQARHASMQGGSSLPWILALGGGGAGLYFAKEAGYFDGIFGGASTPKIPSTKVSTMTSRISANSVYGLMRLASSISWSSHMPSCAHKHALLCISDRLLRAATGQARLRRGEGRHLRPA